MQVPTIKIQKDSARGWHIINLSDFDPDKHVKFEEDVAPVDGQEDSDDDEITREKIAKMHTKTVKALLADHGIEDPQGDLDELRALAIATVFTDL